MRENWPIPRTMALLIVLALLAVIVITFVFVSRPEQDEPELAQSTTEQMVQDTPTSSAMEAQETAQELTEATSVESESEPTKSAAPTTLPSTTMTEMEEYVSITDFFRMKIPAGWSTEETFPGGAMVMANSEGALDRYDRGLMEPGDLILNVGFIPYDLFQEREVVPLGVQFDASPDVFMQSILPVFRPADNTGMSEIELVSLSDERDAGMVTVADDGREGLILMFVAGDEVVAFVSAVGYPGEMDAYQEIIFAVADEVAFNGAHDQLYGALLGG